MYSARAMRTVLGSFQCSHSKYTNLLQELIFNESLYQIQPYTNVIYIRVSQHVLEATVIRQVLLHPQAMLDFIELHKVANTFSSF